MYWLRNQDRRVWETSPPFIMFPMNQTKGNVIYFLWLVDLDAVLVIAVCMECVYKGRLSLSCFLSQSVLPLRQMVYHDVLGTDSQGLIGCICTIEPEVSLVMLRTFRGGRQTIFQLEEPWSAEVRTLQWRPADRHHKYKAMSSLETEPSPTVSACSPARLCTDLLLLTLIIFRFPSCSYVICIRNSTFWEWLSGWV